MNCSFFDKTFAFNLSIRPISAHSSTRRRRRDNYLLNCCKHFVNSRGRTVRESYLFIFEKVVTDHGGWPRGLVLSCPAQRKCQLQSAENPFLNAPSPGPVLPTGVGLIDGPRLLRRSLCCLIPVKRRWSCLPGSSGLSHRGECRTIRPRSRYSDTALSSLRGFQK